jgi:hypothetical protein
VAYSNEPDRRTVAVVVTTDGRRVHVPVESAEVSLLSLLRSILIGLEDLLGLIVGNRREDRGTRRTGR